MKTLRLFALVATAAVLAGCSTMMNPTLTEPERQILAFEMGGLKIGSPQGALIKFSQVLHLSNHQSGYDVYEIYNPNSQISVALAYYVDNKLARLEMRYYNGPGYNSLSRSGGWMGIRDYLVDKFGPPSRVGPDVPIVTTQQGVRGQYAKCNAEWIFSRVDRKLNYVALSDASGGVAVVTVSDTTPIVRPTPIYTTTTTKKTTAAPAATPAPTVVRPPVYQKPNPGF